MAQLFLYDKLCQNHAKVVKRAITSDMDASAVQELRSAEESVEGQPSAVATACPEIDKEPSALLW